MCAFVISESIVSFESTRYEVEEGDGHVELTIALTEAVPFNNTSLQLHTIDHTTTSECWCHTVATALLFQTIPYTSDYNVLNILHMICAARLMLQHYFK